MAGTWNDIVRTTEPWNWRESLKKCCFSPEEFASGEWIHKVFRAHAEFMMSDKNTSAMSDAEAEQLAKSAYNQLSAQLGNGQWAKWEYLAGPIKNLEAKLEALYWLKAKMDEDKSLSDDAKALLHNLGEFMTRTPVG